MAEYPYGLSADLTPADRAALETTSVLLGHGRTRTAADLVVGWAAHIDRLTEETARHAGERDVWNAHDYVAALVVRRLAQHALDQMESPLREAATAAITRTDQRLRDFTRADERGVLRRFAADDAGPEWWWELVPSTGPVAEELADFAGRVGL